MISVTARYFALFREQVGADREAWTIPPCTAGELFARAAAKYQFLDGTARCKVAVNDELSGWDTPLEDGDTVLFFPPVAGG
jgi:molybdopterin converting factor subunit 1